MNFDRPPLAHSFFFYTLFKFTKFSKFLRTSENKQVTKLIVDIPCRNSVDLAIVCFLRHITKESSQTYIHTHSTDIPI